MVLNMYEQNLLFRYQSNYYIWSIGDQYLTLYVMGGAQSARINFFLQLLCYFSRKHDIKRIDFSLTSVGVQQKKTRALYLSWFNRGGPIKFKNTFFQIAKLRFSTIFENIPEFSKNSQGMSLKARGLIFWFLALYIHILAPVKTEFGKIIKIVG